MAHSWYRANTPLKNIAMHSDVKPLVDQRKILEKFPGKGGWTYVSLPEVPYENRFAAIGQMALTNYIAQSIIGVFIFYGVGFGLFGQVARTTQACITLAIWMLQYSWSKPWLDSFRFGPLEWLWRSLTYGKAQPMKKS